MRKLFTLLTAMLVCVSMWATDYYLIGTVSGYVIDEDCKMAPHPSIANEYVIIKYLSDMEMFKVATNNNGDPGTWFPSEYEDYWHEGASGWYTIYFRPDGDGGDGWWEGYIKVEAGKADLTPKYSIALADGIANADKVTLNVNEAAEGATITLTPIAGWEITSFRALSLDNEATEAAFTFAAGNSSSYNGTYVTGWSRFAQADLGARIGESYAADVTFTAKDENAVILRVDANANTSYGSPEGTSVSSGNFSYTSNAIHVTNVNAHSLNMQKSSTGNYYISSITVQVATLRELASTKNDATGAYSFEISDANVIIEATIAPQYAIDLSGIEHVTISQTAAAAGNTVVVTPEEGYQITAFTASHMEDRYNIYINGEYDEKQVLSVALPREVGVYTPAWGGGDIENVYVSGGESKVSIAGQGDENVTIRVTDAFDGNATVHYTVRWCEEEDDYGCASESSSDESFSVACSATAPGQVNLPSSKNEETGAWSFTMPAQDITITATIEKLPPVYYVVGSMTEWSENDNYKLAVNPEDANEYMLTTVKLDKDAQLKVKSGDNWYPSGSGNDYIVPADGWYNIYFRPSGDKEGQEGWHYGYIYLAYVGPQWVRIDAGDTWDAETGTLTINSNPGEKQYKETYENHIQHLVIGANVTSIGDYAFAGCSMLEDITCEANSQLASIGKGAFKENYDLTSVTIPASVTSIGEEAFGGSGYIDDVYCYPNAADLTWLRNEYDEYTGFKDGMATLCHVKSDQLAAYRTKFNGEVNVTFVGDLDAVPSSEHSIALAGGIANADKVELSVASAETGATVTLTPVAGYVITEFKAAYENAKFKISNSDTELQALPGTFSVYREDAGDGITEAQLSNGGEGTVENVNWYGKYIGVYVTDTFKVTATVTYTYTESCVWDDELEDVICGDPVSKEGSFQFKCFKTSSEEVVLPSSKNEETGAWSFTMPARNIIITATVKSTDLIAAEAVIDLIDAIGEVEYTDECEAKIATARAAYEALSEAQQALVSNYSTLTDAEAAYADLKAADAVIVKINAIGDVEYTEDCKAKIDAARAAYDALSEAQQELVTNLSTLTAAEARYAELKAAADQQAANAVIEKISDIGEVTYPDSKDAIDAARAAYDALTADQKLLIDEDTLKLLTAAEARYKELEDAAIAAAIDAINKIGAIGEVEYTEACKAKIDAARAAYDALTAAEKALIDEDTLQLLTDAEAAYATLEKAALDEAAANAVIAKINAIGEVTYPNSKDAIDEARAAYDALTADQKLLIDEDTLKLLTAAEARYKELEDAAIAAAIDAINKIGAIGEVEYTEACKAKIDAARAAYDALTAAEKALIDEDTLQLLTDAEAAYAELKAAADQAAANAVIAKINAIGTVEFTNACKAKIDEAKNAYNDLTEDQQDLVTNYSTLEAAVAAYAKLETDHAAANDVIALIELIGEVDKSDECKGRIDAAREAYDALTDDQKALVTNYDVLLAAEAAYSAIPTGIDDVQGYSIRTTKVLRNGQVLILRNGETYTVTGQMVK